MPWWWMQKTVDCQVLQQALSDTAELNIHMIGAQLSANGGPVLIRGSMLILVTRAPAQRLHGKHPEVIGIGANHMNSLVKPSSILKR